MLSQRAYAKRRNCSLGSVQRQIASGRLDPALTRDGRGHAKIADPELADALWRAQTRPRIDRLLKETAAPPKPPEDPARVRLELALAAVVGAVLDAADWTEEAAADLAERAGRFFDMPGVTELIESEIAEMLACHAEADE